MSGSEDVPGGVSEIPPPSGGRSGSRPSVGHESSGSQADQLDPSQLTDIADSVPGALYRVIAREDGEWSFAFLSRGIEDLYGYSPQEVFDDPMVLNRCMVDDDVPAYLQANMRASKSMSVLDHEYRITTRSGELCWVGVRAVPRSVEEGVVSWAGIMLDISDRKRAERSLVVSESRYRALFDNVRQGIVFCDPTGRIVDANPAAVQILRTTLEDLRATAPMTPFYEAERRDGTPLPHDEHPNFVALRTGERVSDVVIQAVVGPHSDERLWMRVNAVPLFEDGQLERVFTTFDDVTENVERAQQIEQQASTDFLTGIPNRRTLMSRLSLELDRVKRKADLRCAVLALDLDHFKLVNDTHGHAAGDAVLCDVASSIDRSIRPSDLVARMGGEEFVVILPDTTAAGALAMAERLRGALAETAVEFDGARIDMTVSIGLTLIDAADESEDVVLSRADRAMYEAKAGGRNTVKAVWA